MDPNSMLAPSRSWTITRLPSAKVLTVSEPQPGLGVL